jgi:glycosyltransferase involved in cell wall biosynthesis
MQPRVLFVTSGLGAGGAERFVMNLCTSLPSDGVVLRVASLRNGGEIGRLMRQGGIDVVGLDLPRRWTTFGESLAACLSDFRPTVVQGWMYHGNLAATLAVRRHTRISLAWSVRQSLVSPSTDKFTTRAAIALGRRLSGRVDALVYNSACARSTHEAYGYRSDSAVVIPNGFEIPIRVDCAYARRSLGLPEDATLIGHVARWHPIKDHITMVSAMARIAQRDPRVHFVFAGNGTDRNNDVLRRLLAEASLTERAYLLGQVADVHLVYSALDVLCLSSRAEAMPNVIGEAMAHGVPCVSTDVGDAADLIGETGKTVPARAPIALATAVLELLEESVDARQARGRAAQQRIEQRFSLKLATKRYATLYRQLSCS